MWVKSVPGKSHRDESFLISRCTAEVLAFGGAGLAEKSSSQQAHHSVS